jgi:hypothetical protein
LATAGIVLWALVAGLVGTTWQAVRTRNAERAAREHALQAIVERDANEQARQAESERADGKRLAKDISQKRLTQIEKSNSVLASTFEDLNLWTAEKSDKPLSALLGERMERATTELEGEIGRIGSTVSGTDRNSASHDSGR